MPSPFPQSPLRAAERPPLGCPWPEARAFQNWWRSLVDFIGRHDRELHSLLPPLDWETPAPITDPPPALAGLILGVKDIVHVDGYTTRGGSDLPSSLLQGPEASVVTRLRQAGAHIIGKTVTTEFAYFEPGPTHNPWHLGYTPGGSSSGSAAGVAAGFMDLGIGTQTVGSVIRPAAFCGIPGFKPSFGRIPRDGVLLYSETVDHVGLLARDWDTMLAAAPVVVDDWHDPEAPRDAAVTIGLLEDSFAAQAAPYARQLVSEWCRRIQDAGAVVKTLSVFEDIETLNEIHSDLIARELSQGHADWFPQHEDRYRPRTAAQIRLGQTVTDDRYRQGLASPQATRRHIHQRMEQAQVDLLVCPAAVGTAPHGLGATGDPALNLP